MKYRYVAVGALLLLLSPTVEMTMPEGQRPWTTPDSDFVITERLPFAPGPPQEGPDPWAAFAPGVKERVLGLGQPQAHVAVAKDKPVEPSKATTKPALHDRQEHLVESANTSNVPPKGKVARSFGILPSASSVYHLWPEAGQVDHQAAQKGIAEFRILRYCFGNLESQQTLLPILLGAIARWSPVYEYSSLRILPDTKCNGAWECVCDPDPAKPDALVIFDGTTIGKPGVTASTVGYRLPNQSTGDRNELTFTREPGATAPTPRDYMEMAHELGHAMGLLHEHQRPDRDQYVDMFYTNLPGYAAAWAKIDAAGPPLFSKTDDLAVKMDKVWHDSKLAAHFGWIAMKEFMNTNEITTWFFKDLKTKIWNDPYDYLSIMHYPSTTNWASSDFWMLKKPNMASSEAHSLEILGGGSRDYSKAAISVYDIVAIAKMYPVAGDTQGKKIEEALKLTTTGFRPQKFELPGPGGVPYYGPVEVKPAEVPILNAAAPAAGGSSSHASSAAADSSRQQGH